MTQTRKEQIEAAAAVCYIADELLLNHMAMNTPTDYKKRIEAFQALSIARAEANDAHAELDRLMGQSALKVTQ